MEYPNTSNFQQVYTSGEYETEKDAVKKIHFLLTQMGLFNIYDEVCGEYEYRPHFKDNKKTPRLDIVLVPNRAFIDAGWKFGAIGIECKKSNVKIGKPLSQILDYSTAVFRLPNFPVVIKPDFIFLWPLEKTHGDIASIMAQNRFGSVSESYPETNWHRLDFYCGEQRVFRYVFNDETPIQVNTKLNFGARTGSR